MANDDVLTFEDSGRTYTLRHQVAKRDVWERELDPETGDPNPDGAIVYRDKRGQKVAKAKGEPTVIDVHELHRILVTGPDEGTERVATPAPRDAEAFHNALELIAGDVPREHAEDVAASVAAAPLA